MPGCYSNGRPLASTRDITLIFFLLSFSLTLGVASHNQIFCCSPRLLLVAVAKSSAARLLVTGNDLVVVHSAKYWPGRVGSHSTRQQGSGVVSSRPLWELISPSFLSLGVTRESRSEGAITLSPHTPATFCSEQLRTRFYRYVSDGGDVANAACSREMKVTRRQEPVSLIESWER